MSTTTPTPGATAWWTRVGWYHPEWPVAVVAGLAWVGVLGTHAAGHGGPAAAAPDGPGRWALMVAALMVTVPMVTAMMLPAVLPAVRAVALTSRWRRRYRAGAVFAGAYLLVWVGIGAILVRAGGWASSDRWPDLLPAAVLVTAAGWELTPCKRRLLRSGHRIPVPGGAGWVADLVCARAGLRHGLTCAGSCWALMLAMVAVPGDLVLMLTLTAVVVARKVLVRGSGLGPETAAVLLVAAVYSAVL